MRSFELQATHQALPCAASTDQEIRAVGAWLLYGVAKQSRQLGSRCFKLRPQRHSRTQRVSESISYQCRCLHIDKMSACMLSFTWSLAPLSYCFSTRWVSFDTFHQDATYRKKSQRSFSQR